MFLKDCALSLNEMSLTKVLLKKAFAVLNILAKHKAFLTLHPLSATRYSYAICKDSIKDNSKLDEKVQIFCNLVINKLNKIALKSLEALLTVSKIRSFGSFLTLYPLSATRYSYAICKDSARGDSKLDEKALTN